VNVNECARLRDLADKGDRFATLSVAGYITAAAAGAGTLIYFLIARPDRARASNDSGKVRFSPVATFDAAGLRVAGSF
jgi:putative copper export protein